MRYSVLLAALATTIVLADDDFSFTVMDAFKISGGDIDVVVTGKIDTGEVQVGDTICLHSKESGDQVLTVGAIESFRKLVESAKAGDMVGIGFKDLSKDDVSKGDTISASCAE